MLRVGLTGGMATGKSVVAGELERLGCSVLSADRLGHQMLARGGECFAAVVAEFGNGVLDAAGELDRRALGRIVFADEEALRRLNQIVHPAVFAYEERWMRQVNEGGGIAVVEAAILIETGRYRQFDKLIVTWCPEALQVERAMARSGWSEAEVRQRMARQLSADEKVSYADYVIDTSGDVERTLEQTRAVYGALRSATE
jgi:dephospho-CoA kinase